MRHVPLRTAALLVLATMICRADELQLRDGTTIPGKFVAADEKIIVFRTAEGLLVKGRDDVRAIRLGEGGIPPIAGPGGGNPGGSGPLPTDGPETLQPPDGVAVAAPLRIFRWMTFHRITQFQRSPKPMQIIEARISADGSTIIFSSYTGAFTIRTDGTGMVQLTDKSPGGLIDLSADGRRVAWVEENRQRFVANVDGSGRVKLPGEYEVMSMKMTALGDALVILSREKDGVYRTSTTGGAEQKITSTTQVAKALGAWDHGNAWRGWPSGLDISDDGNRIVAHYLWDAVAFNGDGSGIRGLTQFNSPEDRSLQGVHISGGGTKIAWNTDKGDESQLTFADWDGGSRATHKGRRVAGGSSLEFGRDGKTAALGPGLRLMGSDGRTSFDASDWGLSAGEPLPLYHATRVSISAHMRRACFVVEGAESTDQGRPSQLVVMDVNPPTLGKVPRVSDLRAAPPYFVSDGSKETAMSAACPSADVACMGIYPMRDGWGMGPGPLCRLRDDGLGGDARAKDGIFSTDRARLGTDMKAGPGPLTLRFFAITTENHALVVDAEGMEVRAP